MRVVMISDDADLLADWRREVGRLVPDISLLDWREMRAGDADVALLDGAPRGRLEVCPRIMAAVALTAGVDDILADPTLPDVPLYRMAEPETAALMREYVCHHVIRIRRGFSRHSTDQSQGVWPAIAPAAPPSGCSVGVLGLGAMGRPTAGALRDLGYRVCGWSRSVTTEPGVACHTGRVGLEAVLHASDILICLLPLTSETEGLIDRNLLSMLPRGAVLINVGRGRCVVEQDLLAALDTGHVAEAVLDVFRNEPLPGESPFWSHPRVVVTPHVAAEPAMETTVAGVVSLLLALRDGRPMPRQVDRRLGY